MITKEEYKLLRFCKAPVGSSKRAKRGRALKIDMCDTYESLRRRGLTDADTDGWWTLTDKGRIVLAMYEALSDAAK